MTTPLMPLTKFVVEVTQEALKDDQEGIRKVKRRWHNSLYNGSVPRRLVVKIGRNLFVDLGEWERWLEKLKSGEDCEGPGRPRTR